MHIDMAYQCAAIQDKYKSVDLTSQYAWVEVGLSTSCGKAGVVATGQQGSHHSNRIRLSVGVCRGIRWR